MREAVAEVCGLPVLGAIPRLPDQLFPERHMGLVPPQEHDQVPRAIEQAADMAERIPGFWRPGAACPAGAGLALTGRLGGER